MKTYYIIDSLGVRQAVVKANSDIQAVNIYKKDLPGYVEYIVLAVRDEELPYLITNLNKIK